MLSQVLVFVLFLLLAKPGATGLLFLFGLLHGNARYTPKKDIQYILLNYLVLSVTLHLCMALDYYRSQVPKLFPTLNVKVGRKRRSAPH